MKKPRKSTSKREPRVVIEIFFSTVERDPHTKVVEFRKANLDKDSIVPLIQKEIEKIEEALAFDLPEDQEVFVRFIRAVVKESFLNPELRVGDSILNKEYY